MGVQGVREVNLCRADFRAANLEGANLQGIDLLKADLRKAQLKNVDLKGVNLRGAQLHGAELLQATLREAILQDADLTDVRGLLSNQLAGANLSGAKLPEVVGKFEALHIVEEKSQNAKRVLLSIMLGSIYALLTVTITTDLELITNSASSPLPIIGSAIPIVGFYWAAPLILAGVFLYFLIYLERLWESLAKLPAVFPDGTPLDEKIYPWLPNGMVRSHFLLLRQLRPPLSGLQALVSIIIAYWTVPLTLLIVWARYLTRHEWFGTGVQIALTVLSVVSAIMFHRLARETLRGKEEEPFQWRRAFTKKTYLGAALAGLLGCAFRMLSHGAINGVDHSFIVEEESDEFRLCKETAGTLSPRGWIPKILAGTPFSPFTDLASAEVSTKLEGGGVKGANLGEADLRYAQAESAFLEEAHLEKAHLEHANLWDANLQEAFLEGAHLMCSELLLMLTENRSFLDTRR